MTFWRKKLFEKKSQLPIDFHSQWCYIIYRLSLRSQQEIKCAEGADEIRIAKAEEGGIAIAMSTDDNAG